MTRVMIAGGHDPVIEQPGFDLLPDAVIDQHFFRRNRTQRLLAVLSRHPDLIGVGIDEHTAVVVQLRRGHWSVIGQSYVMICLPTEDRFPRLEILKAGESTDIEVLKDLPGATAIQSETFLDTLLGLDGGR
jgi:cyanophycinase